MVEHQGDEADVFAEGHKLLSVNHSDELQLLRVGGADGNNHSSSIAELGEQRRRQIGSCSGDKDGPPLPRRWKEPKPRAVQAWPMTIKLQVVASWRMRA